MLLDFLSIIFLIFNFYISGSILGLFFFPGDETSNILLIPKYIFLGVFLNISYLQIWHLFSPINLKCIITLHVAQILFLYLYRNSHKCFAYLKVYKKSSFLSLFLFVAWICNLSGGDLSPYDSGLYHLPIINWLSSFKLIKGLANLNLAYGINSNLFLLISSASQYPNSKDFLWIYNAVFLSVGFMSFFCIPLNMILSKEGSEREIFARLILLIPLFHYSFYYYPGTSTDLPLFIIGSHLGLEFISFFKDKRRKSSVYIPILIFLGLSIKISFLFLGFFSFLIFLYNEKNIFNFRIKCRKNMLFYFVVASTCIWLYRGIILSGYPFLPISSFSVPVDWKVKKEVITKLENNIVQYGINSKAKNIFEKIYESKYDYLHRLFPQHRRLEMLYPLLVGFFCFIYALFKRKKMELMILIPIIAQLLLWLYVPKNRYSSFASWWFCSSYFSLIAPKINSSKSIVYIPIFFLFTSIIFHKIDQIGQVKNFFHGRVKKNIPEVEIKSFKTNSGLVIFVPIGKDERCFDTNLLCTNDPNENLSLYDESDLKKGFYIKD